MKTSVNSKINKNLISAVVTYCYFERDNNEVLKLHINKFSFLQMIGSHF